MEHLLYGFENIVKNKFPRAFVEKDEHGFRIMESKETKARVLGRGSTALAAWRTSAKYIAKFSQERSAMPFEQG